MIDDPLFEFGIFWTTLPIITGVMIYLPEIILHKQRKNKGNKKRKNSDNYGPLPSRRNHRKLVYDCPKDELFYDFFHDNTSDYDTVKDRRYSEWKD